jgi:hypothetical protein
MTSSPTNASPLRQRTTDDMRMRQGFKGTVQPTRTLEAKQQPAELVLQGKHTLDGTEPLCEDGRVGQRLAPSPGSPSTVRVSADAAVGSRWLRSDPHDPGAFLFTVSRAADTDVHMPFMRTCPAAHISRGVKNPVVRFIINACQPSFRRMGIA